MGREIKLDEYWFLDGANTMSGYAECIYAWGTDGGQTDKSFFRESIVYKIMKDGYGSHFATGVAGVDDFTIRIEQDECDACIFYAYIVDPDDPYYGGVSILRLLHKADLAAEHFFAYKSFEQAYGKSKRFNTNLEGESNET